MAVVVLCPKCTTGLRIPEGSAAAVRCPKCQTVFQPPQPKPPAPAFEVVDDAPPKPTPRPAPPPPAQQKPFSLDDAVRSADRPPRRDDRDDDRDRDRDRGRRRRDDDDDDDDDDRRRSRPRSRQDRDEAYDDRDRRRRDEDEDDDRDRDRPRKGSKFGLARPAVLLVLISLGVYVGTVALHALLHFLAWVGAEIPSALTAILGVLALGGWVVALVGLGMSIAGPAKARGLAIAATAVAAVHLILAIVVAYDGRSDFGGGMRWNQLVTDLPRLDALLTILVYHSRGFEDYLLSLFAGIFELARLILLGLLLGSLARTAKNFRAEGQAKFGWIAAPSAVGIAMLVVVLAAVMAESASKDAVRAFTAGPAGGSPPMPQFGQKMNDFQQQMNSWQQQQNAERERAMDRMRSVGRSIRNWTAGAELLIYLLHAGTLILPGLAAIGVYQSMGRRR